MSYDSCEYSEIDLNNKENRKYKEENLYRARCQVKGELIIAIFNPH
ncbi:18319_t:CDS:2 [Racocetra fulgida]|uniref:18319_t:CDS:1 n=1 Tax=Racocetra fulgida TaxID=60492 RepID=A0A9N8VRJ8_9GLOM|nr:18319_t:CDS:2 [Racocetra fulgida]